MHVLTVTESLKLRRRISRYLRNGGVSEISVAASAKEAYQYIDIAESTVPALRPVELVLIDTSLPGTGGIDACKLIKSHFRTRDMPVVMVITSADIELLRQSFEAGANDCIIEPINPVELLARLNGVRAFTAEIERARAREREALRIKRELEEANEVLERVCYLDSVTGVFNRRYFDTVIKREWQRAQRNHTALSLAIVDLDYFKPFNDTYGHLLGDACLAAVGKALNATTRNGSDLVARYGGEEFAVMLPEVDYDQALKTACLLNQAIADMKIEHMASSVSAYVTASVGISTTVPTADQDTGQLIGQADTALYESKARGRNRATHARDMASAIDCGILRSEKNPPINVNTRAEDRTFTLPVSRSKSHGSRVSGHRAT